MSPKKPETFVTVSNEQAWDMFNDLKRSVDNIGSLVANLKDEIIGIKKIVESHDMLLQKYEILRNMIIGGWVIVVLIGGFAIKQIDFYIEKSVKNIVDNYDVEVINK